MVHYNLMKGWLGLNHCFENPKDFLFQFPEVAKSIHISLKQISESQIFNK